MRRQRLISFLLAALLALTLAMPALAADGELINAALEGTGVPDGWALNAYDASTASASVSGGTLTLSASDYNDIRLTQRVRVEENAVYTLTAEIAAEGISGGRGASLSIDNYSIDGVYIYSSGLVGSSDWQKVSLAFRTLDGQKEVIVALRLGGYSEMSCGTARFRSVSLSMGWDGSATVQSLVTGGTSDNISTREKDLTEARKIQLKSYLHLFVVLSVVLGVVFLFGVYRLRRDLTARDLTRKKRRQLFVLAVLGGLVLRSLLSSATGGHDTDMSCWMGWGNYIAANGPRDFYTAPGHEWYDYPPAYMLVLGCISRLLSAFGVAGDTAAATFAYMLPAALSDIAIALVLMKDGEERGFSQSWCLLLGLLVVFNPAAVVLSGAWGQIDSILTLLLILSFRELLRDRRISAGALYGLAIMIKWQALIYGPVLAMAYLLHIRSRRDAAETALGVVSAVAVMILISLPFRGSQSLFWFVERFLNAAGGYDYASVEAYNFLALIGGNWAPAGRKLLGLISYKALGTVGIVLSVAAALAYQIQSARRSRIGEWEADHPGVLFLAAALCMYGIFTFGHYMHERYVFPVVFLLLFAFVETREDKLLFCSLLLSVVLFLNEVTAMYVISQLASAAVRSTREHNAVVRTCSLAETVSFFLFVHVFIRCCFPSDREEDTDA
ncbi:MAG: DUF2029 domain-containing protein [Oscillospiraceae bacterium]|nr:DUF2029 domain-containing protein [Oscillospiraceae bacterium]